MPSRQTPRSAEAESERMFRDEFDAVIERLVGELDPPLDSKRVTEPRKVALWGIVDPRVDPAMFTEQLKTQGFGQEDLATMMLIQNHPELAEVYAQPVADPEAAADLTELARYPFRLGLYADIEDPDERTSEAEHIHREWMKTQGQAVEMNQKGIY
jgi:hypothetical protein